MTDARREMLLKWKKEKELKKKLDMAEQSKKKPFRVCHVDNTTIFAFQTSGQPVKVCKHIVEVCKQSTFILSFLTVSVVACKLAS